MNSGFDPVVVAPGMWKVQTATQQKPFRFGGSQVPLHLGMLGSGTMNTMGRGEMKINYPPTIPKASMRGCGSASVKPYESETIKTLRYMIKAHRKYGGKNGKGNKVLADEIQRTLDDIISRGSDKSELEDYIEEIAVKYPLLVPV